MVRQAALMALAAAALGGLLLWRLVEGTAGFLVQAWYLPVLLVSGAGLVILAAVALIQGRRDAGPAEFKFTWAGGITAVLVGLPLVAGVAFKPEPLGGASLANASASGRQFSASAASNDAALRNIYQWAYEFQTRPAAEIAGEPVEVIGFVHHTEDDSGDRFHIARFVVACCVADAQGFVLPVQWKDAASLVDDRWVRIKGRIATGPDGLSLIQATEVQEMEAPSNPYIYP